MSFLGGVVSGIGSLVGAGVQSSAAKSAANAQVKAAQIAADTQLNMFGQAQNALQPYLNVGSQASTQLGNQLSSLTTPIATPGTMTEGDLQSTPGYQFTLDQGLKATQNSAAARGLGVSGAALKGAATYATGLSDQTYNTRFNQEQTDYTDQVQNQTNAFNKLYQTAGLGSSAGDALAGDAIKTGSGVASSQTGAGSATAAGINSSAQSTASGITGASGAFNNALNQYLAGGTSKGLFS